MANTTSSVAEMQGLYGPFTIAERVVQKIWLQQDFASAGARLLDGRSCEVLAPGQWNLLGGPDFRQARLRLDGREVTGDVEVHFHARDWNAHGHARNPAYANVALHVLLFAPDTVARHADGREIPALVLLPLLHRDLEDYAEDDALETLTARDEWRRLGELANRPLEDVRRQLAALALERWQRKVGHMRRRVERLGWETAAHQTVLEILGYRHNRVPMLEVAERWPLSEWRVRLNPPHVLMASVPDRWQRHGARPANHPRTRLEQYQLWVTSRPDWPERLLQFIRRGEMPVPAFGEATGLARRNAHMTATRDRLWSELTGRSLPGPRFHTIVCDGLLPLLATRTAQDFAPLWYHWFPGDIPEQVRRGLRKLNLCGSGNQPLSHGIAQGLLGWLIAKEFRA